VIGDIPGKPTLLDLMLAAANLHKNWRPNPEREAESSALLRLAHNAMKLHRVALVKNVKPWRDGEGPLAVICTALKTAVKNQQENLPC
jgi:hypothetical protein